MTTMNFDDEEHQLLTKEEEYEVRSALNRMGTEKPDTDAEWSKLSKRLNISTQTTHVRQMTKWWRSVAAVGAAACIIVSILVARNMVENGENLVFEAIPQADKIVVRDARGRVNEVESDTVEIVDFIDDDIVHKEAEMLTMSTPRGKECKIRFSDGSIAYLNADSELKFPKTFIGKERKVTLSGQAYFNVTKNASHPFVVETDKMIITVVGTQFDVNTYTKASNTLLLVSGKVRLTDKVRGTVRSIVPGNKAIIDSEGMRIENVDVYPYIQWKEGFFYFNSASLLDIMKELGRWYNVNVVFENEDSMNTMIHFVTERKFSLEKVLSQLNAVDGVDVKLEKNAIIVR